MTTATPTHLHYTHVSGLNALVRSLDELHREMLKSEGEGAGAVRLSVANVVAACTESSTAEHAVDVLTAIAERHPSRVVVVLADPTQDPSIEADISFRCVTGTERICAEVVRLMVHGEPAFHLNGIVTPLLIPDIPLHLWIVGAPRLQQAFVHDTVSMCERIVLDTSRYDDAAVTLTILAEALGRHGEELSLGDMAWERTQVWREQTAQAFDSPEARPYLETISSVEIETAGVSPSTEGWLMAGWLASRLGWSSRTGPAVHVASAETGDVGSRALHAVRFRCYATGELPTVMLRRRGHALHVAVRVEPAGNTDRIVDVPPEGDVELVGGLMSETADDPLYDAALARAAELARANQ
jgi:glucose-6-phosphate dehydrogenase assembly protein OpcA